VLLQGGHQAFADHAATTQPNPNFAFQSLTSENRSR
jgi:hypothetical protein